MFKYIFFVSLLFISTSVANEAEDKAEFKRLYAEFNELYANSEDLAEIIDVATKLYEIAPDAYGTYSQNAAVATYNLASLYDEAGGSGVNQYERTAVELYKKYFKKLERLKSPVNENYLEQYKAFVVAEFNYNKKRSNKLYAKNALQIAYDLKLPNLEIADFEYLMAYQRHLSGDENVAMEYFNAAEKRYVNEYGKNHIKVGRTIEWIARIRQSDKKYEEAEKLYQEVISIYENMNPPDKQLQRGTYFLLANLYLVMERFDEAARIGAIGTKIPTTDKYAHHLTTPSVRPPPKYPARAAENGIQGWVLVQFDVDIEGYTKKVEVLESSHEMFERTSINAAKKYRYIPKLERGMRVIQHNVKVRIEFQLAS